MMKKIIFILLLLPIFGFNQTIIYSTDSDRELIQTDINGINPNTLYTTDNSTTFIKSVAMDNVNNKVYWNERDHNTNGLSKLMRSDINSFNEELVLNISTNNMENLQILKDTNLIYWSTDNGKVYNNANGLQNMILTGWITMTTMCVDEYNEHIYIFGWNGSNYLYRTDLDGANGTFLTEANHDAQESFFDPVNNKVYYISNSKISSYDITTDLHTLIIDLGLNGWSSGTPTEMIVYELSSGNPKIMWTAVTDGAIYSVNDDGTGYQVVVTDGNIYSVAIKEISTQTGVVHDILQYDSSAKKILYSTDSDRELIQTDINGINPNTLYTTDNSTTFIKSVAMDNVNNKVYWNERDHNTNGLSKLMRSDINSFNEELVLNISTNNMENLQILKDTNLIYWSTDNGKVYNNANGLQNMILTGWITMTTMCVDEYNEHIYIFGWNGSNYLYRTDLDGANGTFLTEANHDAQESFFDPVNNKVYYISNSKISSYDITTDLHTLIIDLGLNGWSSGTPTEMIVYELSSGNPKIMWTAVTDGAIYSVNDDGTGYQVVVTDGNIYSVAIKEKTGRIQGSVYLDINSDGNYDTTDIPLGNQILELENVNGEKTYLTTKPYGNYSFDVDTSQYTLRFFTDTLWTETSNTYSYNINVGPDTTISNLNFGIAPQITKGDMFVDITTSSTVCNMPTSIWLNVKNIGAMTINDVNLELWFDDTYTVLDPAGGTVNGNKISWNFPIDFDPYLFTGQDTMLNVSVQIPPAPVNGSFIDSVRVSPVQSNLLEMKSNNNFDSISNVLLCSYDPNDKQVVPQKCFYDELDTLDYTIRFQNTGNYPATTVRLVDSLDFEKLDILSFEFIGASHAHTWSLSSPSVLEVVFNNIMLVDSSVSFDDSQGFFKYRIVVRDSLSDMQSTSSAAFIYFDLNSPIVTNLPVVNFIDDGNCFYGGCMDTLAQNYDPFAIVNDGSCLYCDISTNMIVTQNSSGNCDGLIIANSSSSYGPISYLWNTGSTQSIIYGLCSGIYSVSILDTLGCSISETVFIGVAGGCTDTLACNYDSTVLFDDGSCLNIFGCTDSTAFNYDSLANCDDGSCSPSIYGCTDPNAINYYPGANVNNGTCIYSGCTDPLALNFNPSATIDDGSCIYSFNCTTPRPDGLYAYDIIDTRAKIGWNNMNDSACMVWKYFVRYREVGTNSWDTKSAGVGNGLCNFGLNTVNKQLLNLSPNTTYEFKMKAFYCDSTSSNYSPAVQFTTVDVCPDMINLTATTFNNNQSKVRFDWDTTGVYTFARIILRVDTAGSNWQTAGGFGVYYPSLFINKFGLQSGETYRAQGRTFCDSNITAYRSPSWTSPIYWTQPGSIREGGGLSIKNLDVYPNPSNDLFNITFNSDKQQDLKIRIFSIVGAEVYGEDKQQFVGEYIKQISLDNYGKGIYFLEIETNDGVVNKKLILQ